MRYVNYHKHSHKSNIRTPDSVTKEIDYMKRAKELGCDIYSTVEHGFQGDIHSIIKLCEQENMKYIFGAEFYYVENRFEKDKTNSHVIIIAKNENGFKQINKALSIANETGFYGKPRIDMDVFQNVFQTGDVIITTACVAGIARNIRLIKFLKNKFGNDLFLEVQNHNEKNQIELNKDILNLSKVMEIGIIHANDSHYINEYDRNMRNIYLKSKKMTYGNEDNYILDYPSSDEIKRRYRIQGILSEEEIENALKNTLIFEECTNVADNIINKDIKIPKISKNPKQELRNILNKEFNKKVLHNPKYSKYTENKKREILKKSLEAIKYELDIIEKTNTENYFILDYKICKLAKEKYGGVLTKTGRGSAVSFFINYILGLTEINRLEVPITLYPTRFMSIERILSTKSLPDYISIYILK